MARRCSRRPAHDTPSLNVPLPMAVTPVGLCAGRREKAHVVVEIVKRDPGARGFEVLRRRWVVERTFAWIVKNRRFTRDYEQLTAVAETLIIIAATATLIRRWS